MLTRLRTLFSICLLLALPLVADEGMWMPQQIPQLAEELKALGLEVPAEAFADLTGHPMGAIISLGGCSASFVSPQGLIVTNHHCAFGAIQFNSTEERDLITTGFLARSLDEELPAGPGSRVFVTTGIEDVTEPITSGIPATLSDLERFDIIDRRQKEMIAACEQQEGVRCRVASFFDGLQYQKITQMEIRDVRLVYAPALGIGEFGGDEDNWMWPRHTGDWSFYRAYVGTDGQPADHAKENVPYRPEHFLKVSTEGVDDGDLVMVAGYPGRTYRYRIADEVLNAQEYSYPTMIRYARRFIELLEEAGGSDKDVQIKNASRIKGYENVLKNNEGMLVGFRNVGLVDLTRQRERNLEAFLRQDPERSKQYGGILEKLRELNTRQRATRERDTALSWLFRASPMLSQASLVHRMVWEQKKPDLERERGYQERDVRNNLQSIERRLRSIHPVSDRAALRDFIGEALKLPEDQRIEPLDRLLTETAAEGREAQIEAFLDQLYAHTDLEARTRQAQMSLEELGSQDDAFIRFAAALQPLELELERRDKEIAGAMSRLRPRYMEALLAMKGGRVYPDANSTLRVTFGTLKGYYPRDAVWYTPQTTLRGVLSKDRGERPFDSPPALLAAARKGGPQAYVDQDLGVIPVNFLSTCDTTGGNSGSATLNGKGELIGLLFDGNYEAMSSDYLVDPELTRSIHVDVLYMLWVMDAVDQAHNLLREMGVSVHTE